MSPATRHSTRTKTANTHPGGAAPKPRVRRTKEQIAAAKEAEKAAKKKKEVEKQEKLTILAQAEDDIVLEMQAQEASEPRVRPKRPLKRTYAMLNVLEADSISNKENDFSTSDIGEKSENYTPSAYSDSESEAMDPASDSASDVQTIEPPKKKKGKSAKASVLKDIQAKRKHLYPILEESEIEVEEQEGVDVLMANLDEHSSSHASVGIHAITDSSQGVLPFKAGLKKAWMAQRTGDALSEPTPLAPKASKVKQGLGPSVDSGSIPTKRATKSLQPMQEAAPVGPRVIKVKSKLVEMPTEYVPDNSQAKTQAQSHLRPRPRPRPRPISKAAQPLVPETPAPLTTHQGIASLHASPLNYGGIPDDKTDMEEQEAARSSPIKAGRCITSNTIVSIQPAGQAVNDKTNQHSKSSFRVLAPRPEPITSSTVNNAEDSDVEITTSTIINKSRQPKPLHRHRTALIKSQNKVVYETEPEVIEDSDSHEPGDQELESTYDRASVALSEGPAYQTRGSGPRSHSAKYDDLPTGVSRETFKNVFMPTVAKYLVKLSSRDPWTNTGNEYTNVIQCIWDEVFPKIPYKFEPYAKTRCAVTRLINQRTYEWRSKFGNAANEAVVDFEASDINYQDTDYRNEWVTWAMKDGLWPFLYADNKSEDSGEWSGTFASELIIKSLTAHLAYTTNAIVVKKLKDYEAKQPIGALALATTAVERALGLWEKGDLDGLRQNRADIKRTHPKFDSSTWTHKAQAWATSIATLDSRSWNDIINAAQSYIRPTSRKPSSTYRVVEVVDARAKLVACPTRK